MQEIAARFVSDIALLSLHIQGVFQGFDEGPYPELLVQDAYHQLLLGKATVLVLYQVGQRKPEPASIQLCS